MQGKCGGPRVRRYKGRERGIEVLRDSVVFKDRGGIDSVVLEGEVKVREE